MAAKKRRRDDEDTDERPGGSRPESRDTRRDVRSTRRAPEPPGSLPEDESEADAPIRVIKRQGDNLYRESEDYDQTDRTIRKAVGRERTGPASVSRAANTIEGRPRNGRDTNQSPHTGSREAAGLSRAHGEGSTEGQQPPSVFNRLKADKNKHGIVRANGIGRMRVGF